MVTRYNTKITKQAFEAFVKFRLLQKERAKCDPTELALMDYFEKQERHKMIIEQKESEAYLAKLEAPFAALREHAMQSKKDRRMAQLATTIIV